MTDDRPGIIDGEVFIPAGSGIRRSGLNFRRIIPLMLLVGFIVIPIIGGIVFLSNVDLFVPLEYQETFTHTGNATSNVDLVIDNMAGDIEIRTRTDGINKYQIITEVFTSDQSVHLINDYEWDIQMSGDQLFLTFEGPSGLDFNQQIEFNHVLLLPQKSVFDTFDTSTLSGDITVSLNDVQINDFVLDTVSGEIAVFLDNSVINGDLRVDTTSGEINLSIINSNLNSLNLDVDTTSGYINVEFDNSIFINNANIDLDATSGYVSLIWTQYTLQHELDVFIHSVSGDIDLELNFDDTISTSYNVDVVSGSEDVPFNHIGILGGIYFTLDVVSGSVSVDYNTLN